MYSKQQLKKYLQAFDLQIRTVPFRLMEINFGPNKNIFIFDSYISSYWDSCTIGVIIDIETMVQRCTLKIFENDGLRPCASYTVCVSRNGRLYAVKKRLATSRLQPGCVSNQTLTRRE